MTFPTDKTVAEWRAALDPDRFAVLREAATEPPFTGSLLHVNGSGAFSCAGCGNELFTTDEKYDSGCGWPSFDRCKEGSIIERPDNSYGMIRTEILCAGCGGHLGHVFPDGPQDTTGLRYCVNSLALNFTPED